MINNLEETLKNGIHLISFSASWCAPCKIMKKALSKFEDSIDIIHIDTDKNPKIVFKYRVMSVPTIIIYKDGKKISEHVGLLSEEELSNIIESAKEGK